jgi:hypothetical protein
MITRFRGLTPNELKIHEDVFEALVAKSLRLAVRGLAANLGGLLTAASTPTLAGEPPPAAPTVTSSVLAGVVASWTAQVNAELYPYVAQAFTESAEVTYAGLEKLTETVVPKITNSFVQNYLRNSRDRLLDIGDVIWSSVREELAVGYAAGEDMHQLAARIRQAGNISMSKALTVARTEVISAANAGALAQVKQAGFTDEECRKVWLATEDARTRPAHEAADNQVVGINEPFYVGRDYLQFPGDPAGRLDNVVNCRCSLEFLFDDDDIVTAAGDPDWNESEHPRDAQGKFTEKIGSASVKKIKSILSTPPSPSPSPKKSTPKKTKTPTKVGTPLHINTNVIYKQKYAAGTVVAEKNVSIADSVYYPMRLVWSESSKKFVLQGRMDDGKWVNVGLYGKGEAYKKFSKETGWFTPGTLDLDDSSPTESTSTATSKKLSVAEVILLPASEKKKWIESLTQDEFDALSPSEQTEIESKFNAEHNTWGDDVGIDALEKLINAKDDHESDDFDALASYTSQFGDDDDDDDDDDLGTFDPVLDVAKSAHTMTSGAFGIWFTANSKKLQEVWPDLDEQTRDSVLKAAEKYDIAYNDGLFLGTVNEWNNDLNVDSTSAPSTPAPVAPAAPIPKLPHVVNAAEIAAGTKFVGDIGTPKSSLHVKYVPLTPQIMSQLQTQMLEGSKKKWTAKHKKAVEWYTTSVGYQTTNAVLRNDEKQLKKFSAAQLEQGARFGVDLQDAMTPLIEAVELHRGVGAHAFGFDDIHVDTAKLKKLQGTVIQDPGFVSTSIVPPTHISFDYAKKPIKVIVRAPEGTPALYVSDATPGYAHENELILGAGTSFHIDEVRAASADDKAKYGNHTEQVVVLTVVPSTPKAPGTPTVTPSTVAAPKPSPNPPPVSAGPPSAAPINAGKPIHINTAVIYKTKYAHGAVVAVKAGAKMPDGRSRRLVWNENIKKFVLQQEVSPGTWVNSLSDGQVNFNKKQAYDNFSKLDGWQLPPPGMTALGQPQFGGTASGPTTFGPVPTPVPGPGPKTAPSVVPPVMKAVPAVKLPKLTAETFQQQAAQLPASLTIAQRSAAYKHLKNQPETSLGASPVTIFTGLLQTLDWHNGQSSPDAQLSLLQLVTLIDEQGAFYAKTPNTNALRTKIIDWLQTPAGRKTAQEIIAPSSALSTVPATLPGVIDHPAKSVPSPQVAAILAKLRNPADIGVPDTNVTGFKKITAIEAKEAQNKVLPNLSGPQANAVTNYSGSGYDNINGVLRGGATYSAEDAAQRAVHIQDAMRPLTESVLLFRGVYSDAFPGLSDSAPFDSVKKLEGKVIREKGFMSTSVNQGSAFSKPIKLTIEAPVGTPAIYIEKWSSHPNEKEMLLAAGLKYLVVSVTPGDGGKINVRLRVVP